MQHDPVLPPRGTAAYPAFLQQCQEKLDSAGLVDLPGFVPPDALAADIATVSERMKTEAFRHVRTHNIYFQDDIAGLPADHPALRRCQTSHLTLCADQLAQTHVGALYRSAPLRAFLADLMGKSALYEMADPLAAVNVMRYGAGEALNWHFDRSEFTITVLLQAPDAGGVFEYRTDLRSEDDPNYAGVARLLDGTDPEMCHHMPEAGTLTVFRGRNTAHRVTAIAGDTPRLVAVLSYFDRPGVVFSEAEQRGFYGRALAP